MELEDIKNDLLVFKDLVNKARAAGMYDDEIIKLLGLKPMFLSNKTLNILAQIKLGTLTPDTPSVAAYIKATRGAALYHINRLKEAGLL